MYIDEDLIEFELIVTLKGKIFDVNLNYLDTLDLVQIEELAIDLGIDNLLTYYDLEPIYESEYEKVECIYKQWCEDIIDAYEGIIKQLNGRLR